MGRAPVSLSSMGETWNGSRLLILVGNWRVNKETHLCVSLSSLPPSLTLSSLSPSLSLCVPPLLPQNNKYINEPEGAKLEARAGEDTATCPNVA